MTLILLAISFTITLCVVAYHFAMYTMPFMVGLAVFRLVHAMHASVLTSGIAAISSAVLSMLLLASAVTLARTPAMRYGALTVFVIPAVIGGYALVYGVAKTIIDSTIMLNLLAGAGGLSIGFAALNHLGEAFAER